MKHRLQKHLKNIVKSTFPNFDFHVHCVFTVNMFATWHFTKCFLQSELSRDVFVFYFLIPLSAETPSFESISGRQSSKTTLKSRCFRWEVHEKVKQKNAGVSPESPSTVKNCEFAPFGIHFCFPADPPDPLDPDYQVSESGSDPTFHTRRGPGWR